MNMLKDKYDIVWLDVDYDNIINRRNKEAKERPIVYPEGISSFEELYNQRIKLYPKYTKHRITVSDAEDISTTLQRILRSLINN